MLDSQGTNYEILVINDGSQDNTGSIGNRLAITDGRIRIIHHAAKRGIGAGFISGLQNARGKLLFFMPADLPMEPAELDKYMSLAPGNDIVIGCSTVRSDCSWWRRLISWTNIRCIQFLFNINFHQFFYCSMYRVEKLRLVGPWSVHWKPEKSLPIFTAYLFLKTES